MTMGMTGTALELANWLEKKMAVTGEKCEKAFHIIIWYLGSKPKRAPRAVPRCAVLCGAALSQFVDLTWLGEAEGVFVLNFWICLHS